MAYNILKNALSPKILSPARNFVVSQTGERLPSLLPRPNVVKKLEYSPKPTTATSCYLTIPGIKSETHDVAQCASPTTININTPVKRDLIENGLEKFKNKVSVLGKGSFGTVFKANYKGNNVAIKIITVQSIIREKNALNLDHENVLKVLEIIENPNHQKYGLIVMEYLPNCKDLQFILSNQALTSRDKKAAALDITKGLIYLHRSGVLHLDLKPKNIIVEAKSNVCKICDFGNSVRIDDDLSEFSYMGTVLYAAPELLLGQKPTTKSDVYSLGLILWQLKYLKDLYVDCDGIESVIYRVGKYGMRPDFKKEDGDMVKIFTKCWNTCSESRPEATAILIDLEKAVF